MRTRLPQRDGRLPKCREAQRDGPPRQGSQETEDRCHQATCVRTIAGIRWCHRASYTEVYGGAQTSDKVSLRGLQS